MGGLLALAQSYTSARLQSSLVRLQKEARKRAEVVKTFVLNRVRDGLREKIDLYRARSNVHLQEEQVLSALKNLEASLEGLSATLHRKVTPKEIEQYNVQKKTDYPRNRPHTEQYGYAVSDPQTTHSRAATAQGRL